mgnify:CR=1 FL=1
MLGNAKIEGLVEDLNLKGIQYNVVAGLFFVSFVLSGMFILPITAAGL